MLPGPTVRCTCECHRAPDEESPPVVVVSLYDPIETYAAGSCCRNNHWRAIYFATEPQPKAPPAPWTEPPDEQADGWKKDR